MDIEQKAFERLRFASETSEEYYGKPLIICYSGGKDSDVLLELAKRSGISFEVLHNKEFARYPAYEKLYIGAFERMLAKLKEKNENTEWKTGLDVFRWWMEEDFRQVRIEDLYFYSYADDE